MPSDTTVVPRPRSRRSSPSLVSTPMAWRMVWRLTCRYAASSSSPGMIEPGRIWPDRMRSRSARSSCRCLGPSRRGCSAAATAATPTLGAGACDSMINVRTFTVVLSAHMARTSSALALSGSRSADPRAAVRWTRAWRTFLQVLLLYVLLRPLMGFGHEISVAGLAWLAHAVVATGWWTPLVGWVGLDPIYAGAAIRALGGVDLLGLSVADPIGSWLHSVLPIVFQAPSPVAPGAGVSMGAAPGTSALGGGLASLGADVLWLAGGLWAFWRWRDSRWALAQLGLLVQAQIAVNHVFGAPVSLRDVDASG